MLFEVRDNQMIIGANCNAWHFDALDVLVGCNPIPPKGWQWPSATIQRQRYMTFFDVIDHSPQLIALVWEPYDEIGGGIYTLFFEGTDHEATKAWLREVFARLPCSNSALQ